MSEPLRFWVGERLADGRPRYWTGSGWTGDLQSAELLGDLRAALRVRRATTLLLVKLSDAGEVVPCNLLR